MDLIYADKSKNDVGVLQDYSFDLAFGSDENNFELTVSINNNVCQEDYLVYVEGTEYCGIIDGIAVDTSSKTIKYLGRTLHGILNSKILEPNSGQDYLVLSGDANTVLGTIISRIGLTSVFKAKTTTSGITLTSYKVVRYGKAYDVIRDMLDSVGAKLKIEYLNGYATLSAVYVDSYLDDELDSDHIAFKIEKTYNPVNHLICLGKGDLKDRTVVNLYADASGNISTTRTFSSMDDVTEVYDYPNAESTEQLTTEGKKKLKELNGSDLVEVSLDDTYSFDIGDVINATDITTGISVTRKVLKKIVTINKYQLKVNYKVGE